MHPTIATLTLNPSPWGEGIWNLAPSPQGEGLGMRTHLRNWDAPIESRSISSFAQLPHLRETNTQFAVPEA